ncbi:anti-anti-sigma factor [Candidatus Kryptobacter tengchongensis]|uniref:Anti-sigma factor antagonist n=1 Tax=Kryptobacter tengchongensis TaxID=1643429 RepID=A0A656DA03_KRYT1|nr:STAS domain-containing protein [Candidatus Kryptobacter tengchongensis]CUS79499.1 anti-anti-sigma factor [Candidatus Kryptobacter tengchongensis]CUS97634.1 anti-anti-sigma factor [Candidatus Kryptobacter tengchongensis]CUT04504.1 anti-anti-sigma factor [Candidatus Kryptobacter tengchongensis]CUU03640.1 anti-anti-sigma factor [Candidatus Kryptobacter tengchongensis]CUU08667.1 anti-anti-sigma factor [Candidatus Kryptobacter tengchongensis]
MNFEISKPSKDTIVFKLREKKLDMTISPELKAEFLALCQSGVRRLIIDLSQVEYCDSSGLSSLLLCERRMRENNGETILVGVGDKVLNLLKIVKLDSLFQIYPTVEEAIFSKTKK